MQQITRLECEIYSHAGEMIRHDTGYEDLNQLLYNAQSFMQRRKSFVCDVYEVNFKVRKDGRRIQTYRHRISTYKFNKQTNLMELVWTY